MKVLVLGGTGWLGGRLAESALGLGHDVVCLARGRSGKPPAGASFLPGDRSDPEVYNHVADEDWDAVFDPSSQPGHVRYATAALAEQTRLYVFVSSISVYADHRDPGLDEDAPLLEPLEADVMPSLELFGQAKVACEHRVVAACGREHSLIVRPGLIAGPGDRSDRTGYWPYRFAHPVVPDGRVLVPDSPADSTQVIDVRDLGDWLLAAALDGVSGVYDATGVTMPLPDHLEMARGVARHTGAAVLAPGEWLHAHDVQPWSGPRSLPLWTGEPGLPLGAHTAARARSAGLVTRPLEQTLADTLAWEETRQPPPVRAAGLADDDERALLEELSP